MITLFTLNFLFNCVIYIIIGTLGATTKELYDMLTKKTNKISIKRLIVGGILSFIIMPTLEALFITKIPIEAFLLISFLIGVLSMELFNNISTISKLKNSIKEIKDAKNLLNESNKRDKKNSENPIKEEQFTTGDKKED